MPLVSKGVTFLPKAWLGQLDTWAPIVDNGYSKDRAFLNLSTVQWHPYHPSNLHLRTIIQHARIESCPPLNNSKSR